MPKFSAFLIVVGLIVPMTVMAVVGVGINRGKIQITEPLKAGGIYQLPSFAILNTGTEPSWYQVGVEYYQEQLELRPAREWFRFEPLEFYLEAGESQKIESQLTLPLKAKPGDYFSFVEGRSIVKEEEAGIARVGVAAGAQLYFTITPANIFQAIYYRISAIFITYSPWSWIVLIIVIGAVVIVLFRKYFKFQIGISRKTDESGTREEVRRKQTQTRKKA